MCFESPTALFALSIYYRSKVLMLYHRSKVWYTTDLKILSMDFTLSKYGVKPPPYRMNEGYSAGQF